MKVVWHLGKFLVAVTFLKDLIMKNTLGYIASIAIFNTNKNEGRGLIILLDLMYQKY